MLPEGLYEQVISKALDKKLSEDSGIKYDIEQIDNAEAPSILSKYIAEIAEKGLMQVQGDDISGQISLANKIISVITEATGDDEFDGSSVEEKAQQLLAVVKKKNNIAAVTDKIDIPRPETSLSASSLFTGSLNEPSMMTELKKEICSADRVDMLVSFIKWSGLRLIINELNDFTMRGGRLRIITTSYMGAILDIYDRRIVSYKIGTSNNNRLVFETFDEAAANNPTARPLFHSDRGFQYTNKTFHNMLMDAGMRQSMSRVGRCIDNGPMEGFWGILKSEMYYLRKFSSKEELTNAIEDYIEFYNTKRYQLKLKCMTPMEYHSAAVA